MPDLDKVLQSKDYGGMTKRLLLTLVWVLAMGCPLALADKKAEAVSIYGWLAEIDPSAHTFAIRHGKKLLQFTTIPSRTNIQVDDWRSLQTSLGSARVGDAVLVKLSLEKARPYVKSVLFTHRPATATAIEGRPGFVTAPYSHTAFDVRKCEHGEMVQDLWPGKIFLVP